MHIIYICINFFIIPKIVFLKKWILMRFKAVMISLQKDHFFFFSLVDMCQKHFQKSYNHVSTIFQTINCLFDLNYNTINKFIELVLHQKLVLNETLAKNFQNLSRRHYQTVLIQIFHELLVDAIGIETRKIKKYIKMQ